MGIKGKHLLNASTKNDPRVNRVRKCFFLEVRLMPLWDLSPVLPIFCIYIGELLDFSDEKMERLKH